MSDVDRGFNSTHQAIDGGREDLTDLMLQVRDLLSKGGGGGTSDGMEARVAKLEAHVEHIQSDIGEIKPA